MKYGFIPVPEQGEEEKVYTAGANVPTVITRYPCFCKKGALAHHTVPGFDDDFWRFVYPDCEKRFRYVTRAGSYIEAYYHGNDNHYLHI